MADPMDFAPSEAFWSDFVNSAWNKRPVALEHVFHSPIARTEEIFRVLQVAARDYKHGEAVPALDLYVNRGKRFVDLEQHLVSPEDQSFESYCRRIEAIPGLNEFTFVLYSAQLYERALWTRTREFLAGLYSRIGVPASHVDLDIFVGNYRRTPTGIHRDAAANFSFVIHGCKRMAFWPSEVFRSGGPGTADYSRFPAQRIILQGEPGDLIFWPHQYWHMAFSEQLEWSITLNVALYVKKSAFGLLNQVLSSKQASSKIHMFTSPELYHDPEPADLPAELYNELMSYRSMINHSVLEDAAAELWARRLSASGFTTVPPPLPVKPISRNDILCAYSEFPIIIRPLPGGRAIVAANGYAILSGSFDTTEPLIRELNLAHELRVGEIVDKSCTNNRVQAAFMDLISRLESFGAFSVKREDFYCS